MPSTGQSVRSNQFFRSCYTSALAAFLINAAVSKNRINRGEHLLTLADRIDAKLDNYKDLIY